MKIFKRAHLPSKIKYNGTIYKLDAEKSVNYSLNKVLPANTKFVMVQVLQPILRGRTDLHGKLYKPTIWIFCNYPYKAV